MSKTWKIIIGVGVAAVIVVGAAGLVFASLFMVSRAFARPGLGREVAPDYSRRFGQQREIEVRLIDDNEDGIPDRGVIEGFAVEEFDRQARPRPGAGFDRRFDGRGRGLPFGRGFSPFVIIGGLFRLAVAALLIGLGIVIGRTWRSAPPAGSTQTDVTDPAPVEPDPAPEEDTPGSAEPEAN